ncbi:MAG: hypothetical protein ACRBK7_19635 [Acidimicrobiales bacterium]
MAELLQLRLQGTVIDGVLNVESRHGSLDPQHPGLITQLNSLRALNKDARANRTAIQNWD